MNTLAIILLIIVFILIFLLLFIILKFGKGHHQNYDFSNLKEVLGRLENELKYDVKNISLDQKENISKWTQTLSNLTSTDKAIIDLNQQFKTLEVTSNTEFKNLSQHHHQNLQKLQETVLKLDQNLENLKLVKNDIGSLNQIFYNTRHRGSLGEFSLFSILDNILGKNEKIWKTQEQLAVEGNKSRYGNIDVLIYTADGKENIAIDSKFPLENYQKIYKIIDEKGTSESLKIATSQFENSMKEKIKEVKKYINPTNNITNAILFIPSEAVFGFLITEMPAIFEDSFKSKVWICSPTTLGALLHIISQMQKDYQLNKDMLKIKVLISKINSEYERFGKRWENLKKKILENHKEITELDTTISKIQAKQEQLESIEIDK